MIQLFVIVYTYKCMDVLIHVYTLRVNVYTCIYYTSTHILTSYRLSERHPKAYYS